MENFTAAELANQNVFFLHKDDAKEFQHRCIIAIFLEIHKEVQFVQYLKPYAFRGKVEGKETNIYLFNKPGGNEEGGIIYRVSNRGAKAEKYEYRVFRYEFINEYTEYRDNVYDYIMDNFFDRWKGHWGDLFRSNPPRNEKAFKYKQVKEDAKSTTKPKALDNYFVDFLQGAVTFSRPDTFNDPFDCDCHLPDMNSMISLLWNAFRDTKFKEYGTEGVKRKEVAAVMDSLTGAISSEDLVQMVVNESVKNDSIDPIPPMHVKEIADIYDRMSAELVGLKNRFRVLCTADKPNDILMWGYYTNGGDGVCCKYDRGNIVDQVFKSRTDCICVWGDVKYKPKKPVYHYSSGSMTDNIFEYVLRCVFTKSRVWQHENEFRFVLMEKHFADPYIPVNVDIKEYYMGKSIENANVELIVDATGKPKYQINMAKDRYDLIWK